MKRTIAVASVADGDLTEVRAEEAIAEAAERLTLIVNGERPAGRFGRGGHHVGSADGTEDGETEDSVTGDEAA